MSFTVVIPARYGSTRLPGKPMLDIGGKPMVQHVYERACESEAARVVVATDDDRIFQACADFGAQAIMTSPEHPSGTDRIEEVSAQLGLDAAAIVVNVQGDEPLIPAAVINQVAANLAANDDAGIATLSEPLERAEDLFNPNVVKVVCDNRGLALYFSRAPIPWERDAFASESAAGELPDDTRIVAQRHLGIYAYRVAFLQSFVQWPPTPLERMESLEQLRAMENGTRIHVAPANAFVPAGVDTQEDLDQVRALLSESVSQ